jgi:nitrogen-specific signal transduction histidine kinase
MGLAHEIRNPLGRSAAPCSCCGASWAPSRAAEYTDVLLKEVDRVNRIIEMLLDLGAR